MATKKQTDTFANIAFLSVTESAANTLTFAQLQLANTLMAEKAALIIHRADFFIQGGPSNFNGAGDKQSMAITLTDRLTDISDLSQPEILFMIERQRWDFGAAASGFLNDEPSVADFNTMPGAGILVPADRIYIAAEGTGLVNPSTVSCRLYYTVKPLDTADYWDLIEARRIMTT